MLLIGAAQTFYLLREIADGDVCNKCEALVLRPGMNAGDVICRKAIKETVRAYSYMVPVTMYLATRPDSQYELQRLRDLE